MNEAINHNEHNDRDGNQRPPIYGFLFFVVNVVSLWFEQELLNETR